MAMTTVNTTLLTRTDLWANMLKEAIQDKLDAQRYVRWLTDFPDGNTLHIPSIGEGTVRDYVEDTAVVYDALDTGEFTFTITDYVQSGNYITMKARQDVYYAAQLEAAFVPKQSRALAENLETKIFALAQGGASGGQTVSNPNTINGAAHRMVASGTDQGSDDNEIALKDFSRALFALKRANVPDMGLIAVVDPSVEYTLNNLTNIVNVSNNPMFEGIVNTGIGADMRFIRNIYGFDVYVSNYLAVAGTVGTETITDPYLGADSIAAGKCNIFCSLSDQDLIPFVGAWRQMPRVDGKFNQDRQREEYVTTARWGLKVYRPENLVVVLSSTDVIV